MLYLAADSRSHDKCIDIFRILRPTFPYDQDVPSVLLERFHVSPISLYVLPELLVPELDSGLRCRASSTPFVAMPEAPVNEDHQPMLAEDNIRRARQVAAVHTKAKSQAVSRSTHDDFRCGVFPPNTPHERGSRWRRRSFEGLAGFRVPRTGIVPHSHMRFALKRGQPIDCGRGP